MAPSEETGPPRRAVRRGRPPPVRAVTPADPAAVPGRDLGPGSGVLRPPRRGRAGVAEAGLYTTTPGTFVDFIDGVVPILQERGLVQPDYGPGPLRRKLFGHPRLPADHPGARVRR